MENYEMKNFLPNKLKYFLKAVKIDILYYFMRSNIHLNKVAITVEKDLSSLRPLNDLLVQADVQLVTITPDVLTQNTKSQQSLVYPDEERRKKAMKYLEKGYRGIAVVSGNEVSGDIWYTSACSQKKGTVHPDLKWLKMKCGDKDAYAFDMYLHPGKRGRNLANLLQNGALHEIRKGGYGRALGYYWAENIPALWVHRTLQWKELRRVKVTRFLSLRYSC
jgi:GNAT superfamily N-acetyltransferase